MASEIHELFKQARRPTAKHDNYFAIYDELFGPHKGRDVTFVEIGISGGGSLEVWKQYFGPNARIIGIDLNPALKQELERGGIEVHIGDQADPAFWRELYAAVGSIDILLDDGGHTNSQTWTTVVQSLPHVRDGGLVIIEDTHASYMRSFGNPSSASLVERLFAAVDLLHYRSSEIDELDRRLAGRRRSLAPTNVDLATFVHSIQFFESVVALRVDRRKCVRSARTRYGSAANLAEGVHPEDFRHRGIRESLVHRLQGKARRLLARLPRV
jgi:hypothetical protein